MKKGNGSRTARALTQSQLVNALADMGQGYAALLLGAGASRSSGVLLAREIVTDICTTAFCREFEISPVQRERVTAHDVREWLELQGWYQDARARGESEYSAVFRQFKPTHDHQIEYIKALLRSATPSSAYKVLAKLIHDGFFKVVSTTNFDPLLENCYSGMFPSEASLRSVATDNEFVRITDDSKQQVIAYLHGNLNGYEIANLDEDTRLLRGDIEPALRRLLNPYALVVVGYSGCDKSVMSLLRQLATADKSAFRRGVIYWCRQPNAELSPMAREILDTVAQGIEVEIHGFDQLMFEVAKAFGIDTAPFDSQPPGLLVDAREVSATPAVLNVALVERLPAKILKFRTGLKRRDDVREFQDDLTWWQATVHDGHLWLIGDIDELPDKLLQKCSASPEPVDLSFEALSDVELWNIFAELSNKALDRLLEGEHQLRKWKGGRYFFPKPKNADQRSKTYFCRRRKASRQVVWPAFERGTEDAKIRYFCHEALRTRVQRFRGRPVLRMSPTRLFTVEGDDVWDSSTAHASVGRSTSKIWNQPFDSLVRLWLDLLAGSSERIAIRFSADGRKDEYKLCFHGTPCPARRLKQ